MRIRHVSLSLPGAAVMHWQSAGLLLVVWALLAPPLLVAQCPPPDPDFHEPACLYRESPDPNTPSTLTMLEN